MPNLVYFFNNRQLTGGNLDTVLAVLVEPLGHLQLQIERVIWRVERS
jgi:hypothetical protein